MNDLISRKALIAEYDRAHVGPPGGARKLMEDAPEVKPKVVAEIKIDGEALQKAVDEAVEQIRAELFGNQAPTIEPRAKGKWDFIGDNMFMCTSCGAIYTVQQLECLKQHVTDLYIPPYCPNCGADMRERR